MACVDDTCIDRVISDVVLAVVLSVSCLIRVALSVFPGVIVCVNNLVVGVPALDLISVVVARCVSFTFDKESVVRDEFRFVDTDTVSFPRVWLVAIMRIVSFEKRCPLSTAFFNRGTPCRYLPE